MVSYGRCQNS